MTVECTVTLKQLVVILGAELSYLYLEKHCAGS